MVSFRIADDIPLVKGKEVIDTSYIFNFGGYRLSDGYGIGRARVFDGERLELKTDFCLWLLITSIIRLA
ncbi:Uncharacterised protein [Cedecea neteri]|uniref:Uncharacterized protein n=1 Tax=Cedecea neteri TaxID=158822 RepID=A0A2X3IYB1_9ENTR|nr:Uncharacterised protein [Cedecea neteri]